MCGLTRSSDHVSTRYGGLECDVRGSVVVAGCKAHVIVRALFRGTATESENRFAGEACCAVGIEGAAHAAANLAFYDDNATRNGEFAVAVNAVGVTGASLCVVYAARNGQESAAVSHSATHAASGAEFPVGLAALIGVA